MKTRQYPDEPRIMGWTERQWQTIYSKYNLENITNLKVDEQTRKMVKSWWHGYMTLPEIIK